MGWSEQDEELAQEIQARVDAETSALKKQVATLTKERDQAVYRMQRIEAEELPNLVRKLAAAQVAVLRDAARIPTRRWKGGPAGEAAIDIEAAISRMADELEKSK